MRKCCDCPQNSHYAVHPWIGLQSIKGPHMNIYGFSILLKGTLAVFQRCFGTFPYYQNTFRLERGTLSSVPNRLSYHHPLCKLFYVNDTTAFIVFAGIS